MQAHASAEKLTDSARSIASTSAPGRAVLVVEPDPDRQWRLARTITIQGHRVIGTSTVEAALALLQACPVDLILVAEELAICGPADVVERLRQQNAATRIVLMSQPSADSGVRVVRSAELEYCDQPPSSQAIRALLGPSQAPAGLPPARV